MRHTGRLLLCYVTRGIVGRWPDAGDQFAVDIVTVPSCARRVGAIVWVGAGRTAGLWIRGTEQSRKTVVGKGPLTNADFLCGFRDRDQDKPR